jgi:hypothetical protein
LTMRTQQSYGGGQKRMRWSNRFLCTLDIIELGLFEIFLTIDLKVTVPQLQNRTSLFRVSLSK